MPYTTVENLNQNVAQFSDLKNVNSASKAFHISRAEAIIDGKLSSRYPVPFSPVPPMVSAIATDLASWSLLRTKSFMDASEKESWLKLYKKDAENLLDALVSGSASLVNSSGTLIAESTARINVLCDFKDYKPVFDLTDDADWEVDSDLVDAENDARD